MMTLAIAWTALHGVWWVSRRFRRRQHEPQLWPICVVDVPTGDKHYELWKYDHKLGREIPRC